MFKMCKRSLSYPDNMVLYDNIDNNVIYNIISALYCPKGARRADVKGIADLGDHGVDRARGVLLGISLALNDQLQS